MAKGISLHIGVNSVDPNHYRVSVHEGWEGKLKGCEADAKRMQTIAIENKFNTALLTTEKATTTAVSEAIKNAAEELEAGDCFLITYSGHGGQVWDASKDERKDNDLLGGKIDTVDETWCLYDRQLLDDELQQLWALFKQGVRILFFSDSCHSGTALRGDIQNALFAPTPSPVPDGMQDRQAPKSVFTATYTYLNNLDFYNSLQGPKERPKIVANIISFAACQDDQLAREDQSVTDPGGLFTKSVVKVWAARAFTDYSTFFDEIKTDMEGLVQEPKFLTVGEEVAGMPFELG